MALQPASTVAAMGEPVAKLLFDATNSVASTAACMRIVTGLGDILQLSTMTNVSGQIQT